jgi:cephalosporin-C deacetylase
MNHPAPHLVLGLFAASLTLFLGVAAFAQAQQPTFTPFHPNGIYALGEKVGWSVTPPTGAAASAGSYTYTIKTNDFDVLKTGSFDLSSGTATIETSFDAPAMLHVTVDNTAAPPSQLSAAEINQINDRLKALLAKGDPALKSIFDEHPDLEIVSAPPPSAGALAQDHVATLGAAVAPTKLQPSVPRPADFDAFWAGKLAALKKVPIRPVITSTPTTQPGVKLYTVTLDSLGSHVHGYLAKPNRKGKFPALVIYQYAGVYALQPAWATNRAAEGWLVFNVDSHDLPPDQGTGVPKDYYTIGNNDREHSYFLNMYLRDTRALDFVSTLPSWDRKTIVVTGTSMGGQQSLVTAGLNPGRVTAVVVNEPSGADSNGELHGRKIGYPNWPASNPDVAKTALYFDTVNFASRIKAPTLLSVGFIDSIVLPAGLWTAFNQIPGPKEVVPMVESDHNNLTPQKQGAYLQRSEEVLATILHGGRFIPNEELSRPKP